MENNKNLVKNNKPSNLETWTYDKLGEFLTKTLDELHEKETKKLKQKKDKK